MIPIVSGLLKVMQDVYHQQYGGWMGRIVQYHSKQSTIMTMACMNIIEASITTNISPSLGFLVMLVSERNPKPNSNY